MTAAQINTEMKNIEIYMKERSIEKNRPILTITFAVENVYGEQVIDMEIMIPARNSDNLTSHYTLKEEFYLTNAVYKKHKGTPELIINTYNELNNDIVQNGLIPITTEYNVNVKDQSQIKIMDDI